MAIYVLSKDNLKRVEETSFAAEHIREREDLQRLLKENIAVLSPDLMVVAEEFSDWQDSRRRIDLLCLDKKANLVVVELKRTEDGGHMELQAIRYAAMVSTMTFTKLAEIHEQFLKTQGSSEIGQDAILNFLDWDEPNDDQFAQEVHIILASADFSTELTSSVIWLRERELDIRCIRLKPYRLEDRTLLDVQQLIPLPEAADYQVKLREKEQKERQAKSAGADWTRFDTMIAGKHAERQYKRAAIFFICKSLCDNGVNPEEITKLIYWRPTRVWRQVPGEVDSKRFIELAKKEAEDRGSGFNAGRWFCDEEELIRANGKTYAFCNQWGGKNWHKAMDILKENYSKFEIDYRPSD